MREMGIPPREETKRLHDIWAQMKQRCNNPKSKAYRYYGGRGMKLCAEWETFQPFCDWAFANGYDRFAEYGQCTIDRINNDGNYEPDNCRWVTMSVQQTNKRQRRKKCVE